MDDPSTPDYEAPQAIPTPAPWPAQPAAPATPGGTPPGTSQAPKKKPPVWLIVFIVLVVLGLCTCGSCTAIGLIGASQSGSGGVKPATQSGSGGAVSPEATAAPAEQPEQPAPVEQPKTWVKVAELSGQANKRSAPFELTGAPARLKYTVTGKTPVVCGIYLLAEGTDLQTEGGFPEVMVSDPGSDETRLTKSAGKYFLDVSAANCSWTVVVEEER